jgi:DNA helicase-2/ATP-dependent DNA helicase PcrA
VAGAGTGKTAVITQRIAWLIKNKKLAPENILALTFTEKAAEEMEVRVDKELPYGYVDLWISTFHAFCQKILKLHGLDIGLPGDFKVLTQTDAWLLIREHLNELELDYYRPLGNPTKFIHALVQHFGRAKDELVYPADYLAYAEKLQLDLDNAGFGGKKKGRTVSRKTGEEKEILEQEMLRAKEVANAYHYYQKLLLDNNALDFGDLINYTLKLFQERPAILAKYRQQFKYILVDEFQDTNYAQYELIKLLATPANNITVVGDDDQSIYKFRGASISNILEFKQDYPDSREVYLNKNYRSCQNILDLSYNFIQLNNPNRLEVKLGGQGKGRLSKQLLAATKTKGKIETYFAVSQTAEVQWVVNKIIELYNGRAGMRWDDFAILVRANDSAKPFQEALQAANVPNYFLASYGLYQKAIIKDIFAYLKLLDDYHESPALWRVLNWSVFGLADQDLIKLAHFASRKQWSLYEALTNVGSQIQYPTEIVAKFAKVLELIKKHTALAREKSVWPVIYAALEDSGYLGYLNDLDEYNRQEQFSYLNSFYKKVKAFESKSAEPTVKNFVAEFNYELESGEQGAISFDADKGPETVKLMTVHSAKGLEFAYVFVVNLVDQRFPTINRGDPIELPDDLVKEIVPEGDVHLEEERRLFYVALTRAKQGLFLTGGEDYGGARKKKPSRFLIELGVKIASLDAATDLSAVKPLPQVAVTTSPAKAAELLPKFFSFSQLKAFETCPWQYYSQYILKVPVKGNFNFSYGKSLHAALQKFFETARQRSGAVQTDLFGATRSEKKSTREIVSEKELLDYLEESWIPDWYNSKQDQLDNKKKAIKSLKTFYQSIKENIPVPLALEKSFFLKIGSYTVKGFIDRIDTRADGQVEIIDYKTGSAKEKLTADDKEQLLIYQLAVQEVLHLPVANLTFYYLDENKPMSFLGSPAELTAVQDKALGLIEKIKQTEFPPHPDQHCRYCNFRDICDYAKT